MWACVYIRFFDGLPCFFLGSCGHNEGSVAPFDFDHATKT